MNRTVEVQTPGRLHFGLLSFGGAGRQFSGLGMMVDEVGVRLSVTPAPEFRATGPLQSRAEFFAGRFAAHQKLPALPSCHLEVQSAPPEHVGLGVGTQLGLAVVAGLAEWLGVPWRDAHLLRQLSGRGQRSAIGTHGFLHGGLLVDAGKLPNDTVGQLAARVNLPTPWRFVLIRHGSACGLAGDPETKAMDSLPPVPMAVSDRLRQLIDTQIVPAARESDWQKFSAAVYQYGYRAGECFALAQGGPFASPEIAKLVDAVRDLGYTGVGQSSWGPTVFVVTSDEQSAASLVSRLQQHDDYQHYDFKIAPANNTGAAIKLTE